jgi:hypothetical protein
MRNWLRHISVHCQLIRLRLIQSRRMRLVAGVLPEMRTWYVPNVSHMPEDRSDIFDPVKCRFLVYLTVTFLARTRMHPKVSGLAAWSENCKWYSSLPLGVVVSLFSESV